MGTGSSGRRMGAARSNTKPKVKVKAKLILPYLNQIQHRCRAAAQAILATALPMLQAVLSARPTTIPNTIHKHHKRESHHTYAALSVTQTLTLSAAGAAPAAMHRPPPRRCCSRIVCSLY